MRICILHLDLGQGGAERQTIDEAIALKKNGHDISLVTTHFDPTRCFDEAKDTNALGNDIYVYGDWIPREIFGKFHALMSVFRMLWAALRIVWSEMQYDLIFVDQVSHVIPFLKLVSGAKVVFYCHFPDKLQSPTYNDPNASALSRYYRAPLDWFEEMTTACADELLCNSRFTRQVTLETFPILKQRGISCKVVHPAIDIDVPDPSTFGQDVDSKIDESEIVFLSLNRYERKKNIMLAIEALHYLTTRYPQFRHVKLIIAGGYDERLIENVDYLRELQASAFSAGFRFSTYPRDTTGQIQFATRIKDEVKAKLLSTCTAVLYTPPNEHFGVVPLEAMLYGKPVIACNSGGPLETIRNFLDENEETPTGFLCDPAPEKWGEAMKQICEDLETSRQMGLNGRQRVIQHFSRDQLSVVLNRIVTELMESERTVFVPLSVWFGCVVFMTMFALLMPFLRSYTFVKAKLQ